MVRGGIRAGVEEIVESRPTYRQPRSRRKLIVHSAQRRVHTSGEVHVNIEGRVWAVVGVGVRLMRVSVTAEEMYTILDDRAAKGSAQLLIRIGENALGDKIRSVEFVATEIAPERPRENIRSRLGDGIHKHAGRTSLAGVKPVRDHLKFGDRVLVEA